MAGMSIRCTATGNMQTIFYMDMQSTSYMDMQSTFYMEALHHGPVRVVLRRRW